MRQVWIATAILAVVINGTGSARAESVCGDVNQSDTVTAGDALGVLRVAVGQDVALTCSGDCGLLEARVVDLEKSLGELQALLAGVTRSDDTIMVSGANVQIVNGLGTTNLKNGLGNLIVGYNESFALDQPRGGSHNLIVGSYHTYSSYGGLVAGIANTISGPVAVVAGGSGNIASGSQASVGGGNENIASGISASVAGGWRNEASAELSSVNGGERNKATANSSTVSGGVLNEASAIWSTVSGGEGNDAEGQSSTVGGGLLVTADEYGSWHAARTEDFPNSSEY